MDKYIKTIHVYIDSIIRDTLGRLRLGKIGRNLVTKNIFVI